MRLTVSLSTTIRCLLILLLLAAIPLIFFLNAPKKVLVATAHPALSVSQQVELHSLRVTAEIGNGLFSSWGAYIAPYPNECFDTPEINGRNFSRLAHLPRARWCYPEKRWINFTPYLERGDNRITFNLSYRTYLFSPPARRLSAGINTVVTAFRPCYPVRYPWRIPLYLPPAFSHVDLDISPSGNAYPYKTVPGAFANGYRLLLFNVYSETSILIMVGCFGLALYLGYPLMLRALPFGRRLSGSQLERMLRISFLPCMGLLAAIATDAYRTPDFLHAWIYSRFICGLIVMILPASLLISILDRSEAEPFRLSPQILCALMSIGGFSYACFLRASGSTYTFPLLQYSLAACGMGFLATIPLRDFLQRAWRQRKAALIAAIAVASPHMYWNELITLWQHMCMPTAGAVRVVLRLIGLPTQFSYGVNKDGLHVQVYSPDFAIDIWRPCSGFEGVTMILFMLSLVVLLDWKLFARWRHLWDMYMAAIALMLCVNVLRIAAFFAYGVWRARHSGLALARILTTETFHSHVGLWIYAATTAIFIPMCYAAVAKSNRLLK